MENNDILLSATISGVHGICGNVKIKYFLSEYKDINKYKFFDENFNEYKLIFKFIKKNIVVVQIEGIDNRNDAEAMIGKKLYIKRVDLPEIEEDNFYYCDIIGLPLLLDDGTKYGYIVNVMNFGAGDIVEISLDGDNNTIFLPMLDSIFKKVNIKDKYILIKVPEFV